MKFKKGDRVKYQEWEGVIIEISDDSADYRVTYKIEVKKPSSTQRFWVYKAQLSLI